MNRNWVVAAFALVVGLLAIAPAAGATGRLADAPPATGRVTGFVRIVGGPYPGIVRRVDGTVTAEGRTVTTATHASAKRGFSLRLPVGPYHFSATTSGGLRCNHYGTVKVAHDATVKIDIDCDVP